MNVKITPIEEEAQNALSIIHGICSSDKYTMAEKNETLDFVIATIQKQWIKLNANHNHG